MRSPQGPCEESAGQGPEESRVPPASGCPVRMGMPQPWVLSLLLVLLPRTWGAETRPPLMYHLTAVSNPSKGSPSFWATGWLGPQQYLSYNSLRQEAQPCGAWMWENQVSWYWEKETVDLKSKQELFLKALGALETHIGQEGNFTLQGLLGCELAPNNSSLPTAVFALNGEDFMQFNPSIGNWSGEWPETEIVGDLWMKQPEAARKESEFLLTSCPERLLGHLERGLQYLEWKDVPARSSVPVIGIVLGFLVVIVAAAGGVLLWNRMRSGLPAPWLSLSGDDSGDLLPGGNLPPEADPHGANTFPATS
ncbi:IgG receptor FcRn large subunit p51 isoform X5 [Cricetulus griseus]|uniref:IgG receptor FcRn large subunit p51 isoform X5 n=1 Tax=Cricetulus griseus TaxID=10029 RepID=A0A9J7G420_CRIGR|nr:IgG receptor FcRn large subunit p51 isoform X5 [Cricetulus griseus]